MGQEKLPLYVQDFGYSQLGLSYLIEMRKDWYSKQHDPLAVGDRVAVLGGFDGGGIGIVHEIKGDDMYYWVFSPNAIYHKPVSESCGTRRTGVGKPTDSALCASSVWEATDALRDHPAGCGLQARVPRRTEERAAMIRWLKEMLLLNILMVP